jgi:hypothetical protein
MCVRERREERGERREEEKREDKSFLKKKMKRRIINEEKIRGGNEYTFAEKVGDEETTKVPLHEENV